MSPEQNVIYRQLQLAGLGIVLVIFGFVMHKTEIAIIGFGVAAYGTIRAIFLKKIIDQGKE